MDDRPRRSIITRPIRFTKVSGGKDRISLFYCSPLGKSSRREITLLGTLRQTFTVKHSRLVAYKVIPVPVCLLISLDLKDPCLSEPSDLPPRALCFHSLGQERKGIILPDPAVKWA